MQYPASGFANVMTGALPGIDRGVGMLAQLPMLRMQAEQMQQQQALQNMKTLIEILNLPDPMGGVALEQFGPKLGVDPSLVATLKKGKEEQRREIAGMLEEEGVGSGPGAAFAMRILQQNPTQAFEFWRKGRERKAQRERLAGLSSLYGDPLEIPRPEPTQPVPGTPPTPDRPYPPAAYGAPAPPPASPGVTAGGPTPAGSIAPAPPSPMPTEPAPMDWQRNPDYLRARARVETAMRAIENTNAGYNRVVTRGGLDEPELKHFTEVHTRRLAGFKERARRRAEGAGDAHARLRGPRRGAR